MTSIRYQNAAATAMGLHEDFMSAPSPAKLGQLERAIQLYRFAMDFFTEHDFPNEWGIIQNNLGNVYADVPTDRGQNITHAIECYEAALRVRTRSRNSAQWAMTQNNLGRANAALPTGQLGENLARAMACYRCALQVRTERGSPIDWAITQNNLGETLRQFPTGDRAENLSQAISCYRAALRVFTPKEYPYQWAGALNNLGIAFAELPGVNRAKNLADAVECFEAALQVYTQKDLPVDWAMTQMNLGNAYSAMPDADRRTNLAQAITFYQTALRVYTEHDFGAQWAAVQMGLGGAYRDLACDANDQGLAQATICYEAALRVFTQTAFPIEWAATQNHLGVALSARGQEYLPHAINCFEAAVRVYSPHCFPWEHRITLSNLGNLFFKERGWEKALDAYEQAISVTEHLRTATLDEGFRGWVVEEAGEIIDRAILSALHAGRPTVALALAERAKVRILADRLWQKDSLPRGVSTQDWQAYEHCLNRIREFQRQIALESHRGQPDNSACWAFFDQLVVLRRAAHQMEDQFARADPDYAPLARPQRAIEAARIAQTAGAVIMELRVTSEGTYIFLAGPGDEANTLHVISAAQINIESLRPWMFEWLNAQLRPDALESVLERTAAALYEAVIGPVLSFLREHYSGVTRLIIVPHLGLNLLPLHACSWTTESGDRHYLLDEYEIAYAPSCGVLERCLHREKANSAPARSLFAVQNPDGSLPFSDWEVEVIAGLFPEGNCTILRGHQATESAVNSSIDKGAEKLFSTHAVFDLAEVGESHFILHDGRLSLFGITALDLGGTWLVVMSACQSGLVELGEMVDEYQGLAAAFLVAGAQTVVASLWPVNDFSTALLMQRFHANLYVGQMAKAHALKEAQQWLRDLPLREVESMLEVNQERLADAGAFTQRMRDVDTVAYEFFLRALRERAGQCGGRPFAHPYYWAAFQCIGAGWPPD